MVSLLLLLLLLLPLLLLLLLLLLLRSPPHHPCDQPELCTGYSAECPADSGVTKSDGAACDW
jgi:hypothetical protein